jgi:hypothetical protein
VLQSGVCAAAGSEEAGFLYKSTFALSLCLRALGLHVVSGCSGCGSGAWDTNPSDVDEMALTDPSRNTDQGV